MAHGCPGLGSDGDAGHSGHGHVGTLDGIDAHMSTFCDGHSHSGEVPLEAVLVSHSFCEPPTDGIAVDSTVDMGDAHFQTHGSMSATGASFGEAIDESKLVFGLTVVGHGHIDTKDIAVKTLRSLRLMELYTPQGSRKRANQQYASILPLRSARQEAEVIMPDGYYQDAIGVTTQWCSFWQLGTQNLIDKLCGRPLELNHKARWNIYVSITQWYFAQSSDYETRVLANVWNGGHIRASADHRASHIAAAQAFLRQMETVLRNSPPSERSRQYRNHVMA